MGSGTTVDVGRRDLDRRAILLGGVAEMAVMLLPYLLGVWIWVAAVGPFVCGVVAGWSSRSFEHEANDGAVAAFLGAVLTLVGIAVLIWVRNPGMSTDLRLDLILFFLIFGVFLVGMFGMFLSAIGAIVAWYTALVRRRSRRLPDKL